MLFPGEWVQVVRNPSHEYPLGSVWLLLKVVPRPNGDWDDYCPDCEGSSIIYPGIELLDQPIPSSAETMLCGCSFAPFHGPELRHLQRKVCSSV